MSVGFEFVDVVSSKEDWSVYKLEDGTIAKARFILIKAVREARRDEFGNPVYSLNSQNLVGSIPPKSLVKSPSPPFTPEELSSSIDKEDIEFKIIKEPWNEFHLADGTIIRAKMVLTMISRTNKFGSYGEPIYLTNAQPMIKAIVAESLKLKKEPPHPTFKPT
jgi:hypothetical protein